MSARLLRPADVQLIITSCRVAAECYLRDALNMRHEGGSARLVAQFLKQQEDALRIADDLESGADMPCFLRRQAD